MMVMMLVMIRLSRSGYCSISMKVTDSLFAIPIVKETLFNMYKPADVQCSALRVLVQHLALS